MKHPFPMRTLALALTAIVASACTMKKQETPDLAGPSELGTSISISVTPDLLQQDGRSQSVITVTARGPNGQPLANVPLRAEILVAGTPTDFGSLSARNVVTDNAGRATLVYTAPPSLPISVDELTVVDIGVTPVGTDFNNSVTRFASLRLVPTGIIVPPANLRAAFTVTPAAPTANQRVLFDASTSQAPSNNPIARYIWDFGDGTTDTTTSRTTTHEYDSPGTYVATLRIEDALGRSATASQSVTVLPGANPTASFVFSPTNPSVGTAVNFNAAASQPAPGRQIVSYTWDFGDGTSSRTGPRVQHAYGAAATYAVTLTVRDDAGRTSSVSQTVTVGP